MNRTTFSRRSLLLGIAPGLAASGLIPRLEATATAAGAEVMVLESGTEQPEALALYASAGYEPIPGFGFYRRSPRNRCMARRLV